jgi:hypothetical protein
MSADYDFDMPSVNVAAPTQRVRFYLEPIKHEGKSAEEGRPVFVDMEMCGIANPGSKDEFIKKVDDKVRQQFAAHYKHWKATQEELVEGTMLSQVPFLTRSQVEELRHFNILTVEQLAACPDTALHRLGHGARALITQAKSFLASAKDGALAAKQAAEIDKLKTDNAALQQQIHEINARFEQLMKERQ